MVVHRRIVVLYALIAMGCTPDKSVDHSAARVDPLRRFDLIASDRQHDVLSMAIEYTNFIVSGTTLRLYNGHSPEPQDPSTVEWIPVYLVEIEPSGKYGVAFIPQGERYIVLDAQQLADIEDVFSAGGVRVTEAVPNELFMALVLLHELGHLANNDSGAFDGTGRRSALTLNVTETDQKRREAAADAFAASHIKSATDDISNAERVEAAVLVQVALSVANVNFIAHRVATDTSINRPLETYFDTGYSHENFELRTLRMLSIVSPDQFRSAVAEFESRRAKLPTATEGTGENR